jgi:hypothetical protein
VSLPQLLSDPTSSPYYRNQAIGGGFGDWVLSFFSETEEEMLQKTLKTLQIADNWFINRAKDPSENDPATGNLGTGLITELQVRDPNDPIPTTAGAYINTAIWRNDLKPASASNNSDTDIENLGGVTGAFLDFVTMSGSDMDPLAAVIAIGNNLFTMASSIMAVGLFATAITGVEGYFSSSMSIAIPLILGAYMLCVVLPITLFANFMFAVIEWCISVFEAVIGMPLWALSFISVTGEGIGDNAMSGVKSLFEIMLRPTVIIIATVGAMIIFSASAHFFNKTFSVFILNYFSTTGTMTNALMCFGSAFLYAMTMFSIGNSCFKMIPTIANGFGRWMGLPGGFSGTMQADMQQISGLTALYGLQQMGSGVAGVVGAREAHKNKKKAEKAADTQHEYDKAYLDQQGIDLNSGPNPPMDSSTMAIYSRAREHKKEKDKKKK